MTELDDLARRATTGDARGGRRPGSGRPKGSTKKAMQEREEKPPFEVKTQEQLLNDDLPAPLDADTLFGRRPTSVARDEAQHTVAGIDEEDHGAINFALPVNAAAIYGGAKAREKVAQAAKAELEYRIKIGQYLPREAVKSALAEAYQAVAQSLRSIPDNLERKLGITPEISEVVSVAIDEAMGELAYAMEQIHADNNERNNTD